MFKKIVFVIIIFFSVSVTILSQEINIIDSELDGFFNIPWGVNMQTATIILRDNGITKISPILSVIFAEGYFAGHYSKIALFFEKNQFCSSTVLYADLDEEHYFNDFLSVLTEKYGNCSHIDSEENDKIAVWDFKNDCSIVLTYLGYISIRYRNNISDDELTREAMYNDL